MAIVGSDPLNLLIRQAGVVAAPSTEAGAKGQTSLDTDQKALTIGEPIPIVFCRRVGNYGGILVSPGASECRFINNSSNEVTAWYELVVCYGRIGTVQVRDVFQVSCRVGTATQAYNARASSWTPGNYITQQGTYTLPEATHYCGSRQGNYAGLSTLSFTCTYPDGDSTYTKQIHLFVRNGLYVTRLLDSVYGPSNNFADLVYWLIQNTSRVPAAAIDTTALASAAAFVNSMGFTCDVELSESKSLDQLLQEMAPYFLLGQSQVSGKRGLRPLLPVTSGNALNLSPITPSWLFNSSNIIPGSFEINYIPLSDRKPFCAVMLWRQQPDADIGFPRTTEVRYADEAIDGPFEQHDLSKFCTSETHAVKAGAYLIARRRYTSHTLRISVVPGPWGAGVNAGDIVRVRLRRQSSNTALALHDYIYQVQQIGKDADGAIQLDLTHFPIDSLGRSLISLDVDAATGSGVIYTTTKTGVDCSTNSSTDSSALVVDPYASGEIGGNVPFGIVDPATGELSLTPSGSFGSGTNSLSCGGGSSTSTYTGGYISSGTITAGLGAGYPITGGSATGVSISGGTLANGRITGATISGGVISNASVSSPSFTGGTLTGATISNATISSLVGGSSTGGYAPSGSCSNPWNGSTGDPLDPELAGYGGGSTGFGFAENPNPSDPLDTTVPVYTAPTNIPVGGSIPTSTLNSWALNPASGATGTDPNAYSSQVKWGSSVWSVTFHFASQNAYLVRTAIDPANPSAPIGQVIGIGQLDAFTVTLSNVTDTSSFFPWAKKSSNGITTIYYSGICLDAILWGASGNVRGTPQITSSSSAGLWKIGMAIVSGPDAYLSYEGGGGGITVVSATRTA